MSTSSTTETRSDLNSKLTTPIKEYELSAVQDVTNTVGPSSHLTPYYLERNNNRPSVPGVETKVQVKERAQREARALEDLRSLSSDCLNESSDSEGEKYKLEKRTPIGVTLTTMKSFDNTVINNNTGALKINLKAQLESIQKSIQPKLANPASKLFLDLETERLNTEMDSRKVLKSKTFACRTDRILIRSSVTPIVETSPRNAIVKTSRNINTGQEIATHRTEPATNFDRPVISPSTPNKYNEESSPKSGSTLTLKKSIIRQDIPKQQVEPTNTNNQIVAPESNRNTDVPFTTRSSPLYQRNSRVKIQKCVSTGDKLQSIPAKVFENIAVGRSIRNSSEKPFKKTRETEADSPVVQNDKKANHQRDISGTAQQLKEKLSLGTNSLFEKNLFRSVAGSPRIKTEAQKNFPSLIDYLQIKLPEVPPEMISPKTSNLFGLKINTSAKDYFNKLMTAHVPATSKMKVRTTKNSYNTTPKHTVIASESASIFATEDRKSYRGVVKDNIKAKTNFEKVLSIPELIIVAPISARQSSTLVKNSVTEPKVYDAYSPPEIKTARFSNMTNFSATIREANMKSINARSSKNVKFLDYKNDPHVKTELSPNRLRTEEQDPRNLLSSQLNKSSRKVSGITSSRVRLLSHDRIPFTNTDIHSKNRE